MANFNFYTIAMLMTTIFTNGCLQKLDNLKSEAKRNQERNEYRQITKISYGNDAEAVKSFKYNEDGDILIQTAGPDTIIFEYQQNKIIKKYKNSGSNWISVIVYDLNEDGRVISSSIRDKNGNEISSYQFLYDQQHYLISTVQSNNSSKKVLKTTMKYKDGNLSVVTSHDEVGKINAHYIFEYDETFHNDINLFPESLLDDVFPNERLGKRNMKLVKQMTNISNEGDTLSLLKYKYVDLYNKNSLMFHLTDVLNKSETAITYQFKPLKYSDK